MLFGHTFPLEKGYVHERDHHHCVFSGCLAGTVVFLLILMGYFKRKFTSAFTTIFSCVICVQADTYELFQRKVYPVMAIHESMRKAMAKNNMNGNRYGG